MNIPTPFSSLHWYRLRVTLVNVRHSDKTRADPFTLIQSIIKAVSEKAGIAAETPIFFHIKNAGLGLKIRQGIHIPVEFLFCKLDFEAVRQWRDAFLTYFSDPMIPKNYTLLNSGEAEARHVETVVEAYPNLPEEGELCLQFMTPFDFHAPKRRQSFISKNDFVRHFEDRIYKLFGKKISYNGNENDFSVLPYYWHFASIKRESNSQSGTQQWLKGCGGNLYLKGNFKNLLPFLLLGSELHLGRETSFGRGYYLLHTAHQPYFSRDFPNKKRLLSSIRDVIEKYDHPIETLSINEQYPFKEEAFADQIVKELVTETYTPSPYTAFYIKKKKSDLTPSPPQPPLEEERNDTHRLIEQLEMKDLIVQQYVLKTIQESFDRFFEESSIGYRKGHSRDETIGLIQSGVAEGYTHVIESDVEAFFPSVDHEILTRLLAFYLPIKDVILLNLLQKMIGVGYLMNGAYHPRVKGLAQGSPLSPILANLYMDSFDEKLLSWNVKMIRYADDFIILTRSLKEAEEILDKAESSLSELGLNLNKEKTSIKKINEGFEFLGMRFDGRADIHSDPEEEFRRLKKPLYITEPYLFLSLNGEAIDIKKKGGLVQTLPLRRISEIMVMDKATFSTSLVKKVTEMNIPMTLTLNSGYYITTIKPDSKAYYDIAYLHGHKYSQLSDTEILCFAKEFAVHKIQNYIALLRQRYAQGMGSFIHQLERVIDHIHTAGNAQNVRALSDTLKLEEKRTDRRKMMGAVYGYEAVAAKEIYRKLNDFVEDPYFHLKKRMKDKPDPINSLFNFGYYLLFSRINATVRAIGLNPYLGFLHSPADHYESLVCDIEELFRARINRFIIRLINRHEIRKEHFVEEERGHRLSKEAIKIFLDKFEEEMNQKGGKSALSLGEHIYVQTMVIRNYFVKEAPLTFYRWEL